MQLISATSDITSNLKKNIFCFLLIFDVCLVISTAISTLNFFFNQTLSEYKSLPVVSNFLCRSFFLHSNCTLRYFVFSSYLRRYFSWIMFYLPSSQCSLWSVHFYFNFAAYLLMPIALVPFLAYSLVLCSLREISTICLSIGYIYM